MGGFLVKEKISVVLLVLLCLMLLSGCSPFNLVNVPKDNLSLIVKIVFNDLEQVSKENPNQKVYSKSIDSEFSLEEIVFSIKGPRGRYHQKKAPINGSEEIEVVFDKLIPGSYYVEAFARGKYSNDNRMYDIYAGKASKTIAEEKTDRLELPLFLNDGELEIYVDIDEEVYGTSEAIITVLDTNEKILYEKRSRNTKLSALKPNRYQIEAAINIDGKNYETKTDQIKVRPGKTETLRISFNGASLVLSISDLQKEPKTPNDLAGFFVDDKVLLKWSKSDEENIRGYVVARSEGRDGKKVMLLPETTETSFVDDTVTKNGEYYYYVCSVDEESLMSQWSEPVKVVVDRDFFGLKDNARWQITEKFTVKNRDGQVSSSEANTHILAVLETKFSSKDKIYKMQLSNNNGEAKKYYIKLADKTYTYYDESSNDETKIGVLPLLYKDKIRPFVPLNDGTLFEPLEINDFNNDLSVYEALAKGYSNTEYCYKIHAYSGYFEITITKELLNGNLLITEIIAQRE